MLFYMIPILNWSRVSYRVLQVSSSSTAATLEGKDIYGFLITFLGFFKIELFIVSEEAAFSFGNFYPFYVKH